MGTEWVSTVVAVERDMKCMLVSRGRNSGADISSRAGALAAGPLKCQLVVALDAWSSTRDTGRDFGIF